MLKSKTTKEVNSSSAAIQKHEGNGDNVAGDKHVTNYFLSDAKQHLPPEKRKVAMNYPEKSGLIAKLEAEGYRLLWSNDDIKAGYETVIITLEDGSRFIPINDSKQTLLKRKIQTQTQSPAAPFQPSQEREMVNRTPRELLSFYMPDRTTQESNRLIQPFVGQWIEVSGSIYDVGHGAPDGDQTAVILRNGTDQIECRFRREWKDKLDRLAKGEFVKIIGEISPTQNGSQFYLQKSELQ
ncbi:MAG: OB-fold nucleic acid binding domain-containing protein [Pseudomonadota bacterium]